MPACRALPCCVCALCHCFAWRLLPTTASTRAGSRHLPTGVEPVPWTRVQYAGGGYGGGMSSEPHDERYWLKRTKEARLQADQLTKRIMLEIAAGFQRLVQYAEERTAGRRSRSS